MGALRSHLTTGTGQALRTRKTLRACLTLRTHRTNFSLRTSGTSRTLSTSGTHQSNLTLESLRTNELGIVRGIDLHLALAAQVLAHHESPIAARLVALAQHVCRRQVRTER